ncbi:hypothetical protein JCM10599A_17050 [Paraburkholderia kururiensis]
MSILQMAVVPTDTNWKTPSATFTREAKEYANAITSKIILLDRELLVQLMVDHDVEVSTASSYQIKKIDSDYFDGDAL